MLSLKGCRAVGGKFIFAGLKRVEPWELVTVFLEGYGSMLPRRFFLKYRTSETPFPAI